MSKRHDQLKQLFAPLNPLRAKTAPHVQGTFIEGWDVIAHLSRIFGPLNWDKEVKSLWLISEHESENPKTHKPQYTATYGATVRLTVRLAEEVMVAGADWELPVTKVSEDSATGTGANQVNKADAHDMAVKTAVTDALKRAAKDLGNQFGLSLYKKGSMESVLGRSLAHPELDPQPEPEEAQ
jgi:recombination DNA repair RAD52 pathway protein